MLKSYSKMVVLQEVPGEISLSFAIAGCPHNCKNCSWANTLHKMTPQALCDTSYQKELTKYKGLATCVLFMGGDWEKEDLLNKLKLAKENGFKTCLYTGSALDNVDSNLLDNLTYIKTGPYIESLGGLDKPTTNQKFYRVADKKILNEQFIRNN